MLCLLIARNVKQSSEPATNLSDLTQTLHGAVQASWPSASLQGTEASKAVQSSDPSASPEVVEAPGVNIVPGHEQSEERDEAEERDLTADSPLATMDTPVMEADKVSVKLGRSQSSSCVLNGIYLWHRVSWSRSLHLH